MLYSSGARAEGAAVAVVVQQQPRARAPGLQWHGDETQLRHASARKAHQVPLREKVRRWAAGWSSYKQLG